MLTSCIGEDSSGTLYPQELTFVGVIVVINNAPYENLKMHLCKYQHFVNYTK